MNESMCNAWYLIKFDAIHVICHFPSFDTQNKSIQFFSITLFNIFLPQNKHQVSHNTVQYHWFIHRHYCSLGFFIFEFFLCDAFVVCFISLDLFIDWTIRTYKHQHFNYYLTYEFFVSKIKPYWYCKHFVISLLPTKFRVVWDAVWIWYMIFLSFFRFLFLLLFVVALFSIFEFLFFYDKHSLIVRQTKRGMDQNQVTLILYTTWFINGIIQHFFSFFLLLLASYGALKFQIYSSRICFEYVVRYMWYGIQWFNIISRSYTEHQIKAKATWHNP